MASLGSSIRSAAQGTSSAYRRLPIRWRLAGGSAVLTLVILCGFATIVGVLTVRRLHADFDQQVSQAADELQRSLELKVDFQSGDVVCQTTACPITNLTDYAAPQRAVVRIVTLDGDAVKKSQGAPFLGTPAGAATRDFGPYRVESRPLRVTGLTFGYLYVQ